RADRRAATNVKDGRHRSLLEGVGTATQHESPPAALPVAIFSAAEYGLFGCSEPEQLVVANNRVLLGRKVSHRFVELACLHGGQGNQRGVTVRAAGTNWYPKVADTATFGYQFAESSAEGLGRDCHTP